MYESNRMKAKMSNRCISQIYQVIYDSQNNYEIGGILLGIRSPVSIIGLQAIHIPSMDQSSFSYHLDGDKATEIVNDSSYEFVGIWHSHTNSCNHFSKTDESMNHDLAKIFDGIISVLAVIDDTSVNISSLYINQDGQSVQCT